MIGFCPLASGSKGNALYFGTGKIKLLLDAGLSARAIKERLESINVGIEEIDAIVVTHDHGDHIRGLSVLAYRLGIPVVANHATAKGILNAFPDKGMPKFKIFTTGEPFTLGDVELTPFSIPHDTEDPVAFTFQHENKKLGVCTDLGFASTLVKKHLMHCDHLVVEANHDPDLVHKSLRPPVYKQRVLGRSGHLSNEACSHLLADIAHPKLQSVHLAHLSSECNTPELAKESIFSFLETRGMQLDLRIARQDAPAAPIRF